MIAPLYWVEYRPTAATAPDDARWLAEIEAQAEPCEITDITDVCATMACTALLSFAPGGNIVGGVDAYGEARLTPVGP